MNIALYFLVFVISLLVLIFGIKKIWESQLAENKSLNLFIIILLLVTIFTFLGIGISRSLMRDTSNIMPSVGETGKRGTRGEQGDGATNCKCSDDTYYKKVMTHITLVYNEWNRINGFPTIPQNKFIKNKYIKNKVNMICNSDIFGNLVKQNGTSKFPYVNFKKGIINGKIDTCDITTNCGAFDLLLETWRKWILMILKYDKGKYFLDSEELTDRDFDTLITDLDKDQSALPGFSTDSIEWIFDNPIIFPNPGVNYDYNQLKDKYLIKNNDGTETFNDDLFEKNNISLYDISDNVKFKKIEAQKRNSFYNSDFYKFYSVNGVVSVDGVNTKSPFDEIKMFDVWYWGSSEKTRPKLIKSCDTVYDDPERKYVNVTWDIADAETNVSLKPQEGALDQNELDQWGTSKFDNFSNKYNSIRVVPGKRYKLSADNTFDSNERWYGAKLEIKDGDSSSLLKLGFTYNGILVFNNDKIRIRFKPDFEFYDEETPKIKIKITNDYDEIWNNQNKRQVKLTSPENISGTTLCKFKNVYLPYRNKGNVINSDGTVDENNKKINILRAKEFSDKDEKELKYKYYKPLGDSIYEETEFNKKRNNEECRPFIQGNKKQPVDYRVNGPRNPTLLVSGDVVKPKEFKRRYIRKRNEGLHKNDFSYSFWEPVPPNDNYICLGDVVSNSLVGKPPSLESIRCLPKKCVEEITDPSKIKPNWTTVDYNMDTLTPQKINNIDEEMYNAIQGDGQLCGVQPNLNNLVSDTDYYFNIDDLSKQEVSNNNSKNIELYMNNNDPDLENVGKKYDFSNDDSDLLSKYNVFKVRGISSSNDSEERYLLTSYGKMVTFNENTQKINLTAYVSSNTSVFIKELGDKVLIYFKDSNNTKKYFRGYIDPTFVEDNTRATLFKKELYGLDTIKFNTEVGGLKKYLKISDFKIITNGRGIPLTFRLSNTNLGYQSVLTKIYTEIQNIRYYLYENTSSEIKLTPLWQQGETFFIDLGYIRRFRQLKIIIYKGNRTKYLYLDDNNLKTSNVQTSIVNNVLDYRGSITGGFTLNNVGYEKSYTSKFNFRKFTTEYSTKEEIPKFYRIKPECIYNPKEFKYKKPEINVGEKYGKDYSVLKVYD